MAGNGKRGTFRFRRGAAFDDLVSRLQDTSRSVVKTSRRTERAQTDLRRRVNALERLAAGLIDIGDDEFRAVAAEAVDAGRTLLGYDRLFGLWQATRNVLGVEGAFAELGSYRGGSAHFLARAARALYAEPPRLYVLDSFAGHPEAHVGLADHNPDVERGQRAHKFADTSIEGVQDYLAPFPEVEVRRCVVPEGLSELDEQRFALVHLDMDLFAPTLGALAYFVPRLSPGGVIVLDDFGVPGCPGVEKAFREFFAGPARRGVHAWDLRAEQLVISKLR